MSRKFGILGLLLCVVSLMAFAMACAPPTRTYTSNISSSPRDATIYWGRSKDNITNKLGTTPYYDTVTGQNPYWYEGYYKAVKKGYQPQVKYTSATYGNRIIHFDLLPLPKFPTPPMVQYPDPESVAVRPVSLESNRNDELKVNNESTIAIMSFKEPEGSGAGSLVADSLILNLQMQGYNVIDREQIEKVMREQGLAAEGKTVLTDLEVSKRLGHLLQADYFIYGAITEYRSNSENVQLSPVITDDEKARYQGEYDTYTTFYQNEEMPLPQAVRTLQEWEMEYASRPKSSYINIARVGVTAKMVDIKSSKIAWVGIANASDLQLQKGMKKVVSGMIEDFTKQSTL